MHPLLGDITSTCPADCVRIAYAVLGAFVLRFGIGTAGSREK